MNELQTAQPRRTSRARNGRIAPRFSRENMDVIQRAAEKLALEPADFVRSTVIQRARTVLGLENEVAA